MRRHIALAEPIAALVAELHVRRQGEQSERQEKYRDCPFEPLEHHARPIRIFAFEPAPLYRQPVETDAAVQLDGKQQDQIQRPPTAAPHALRRFVRADVAGMHEHLVEMNRSQKEERKAGHTPAPTSSVVSSWRSICRWLAKLLYS